jgi:hypothetical protein
MTGRLRRISVLGAVALLSVAALASTAHAEDFLSALFGAFGGHRSHHRSMPFAGEGEANAPASRGEAHLRFADGQAYCVRSCDGRYFPISGPSNESRAASCNNFCPATETKLVYGSNIDSAVTEAGKPYSELPNAFRYRNEVVAGCTCNGKDHFGLARVQVEDDPTLRKGDLVVGTNGLMVANRSSDQHGTAMNFSPASPQLSARYQRVPVVASE